MTATHRNVVPCAVLLWVTLSFAETKVSEFSPTPKAET